MGIRWTWPKGYRTVWGKLAVRGVALGGKLAAVRVVLLPPFVEELAVMGVTRRSPHVWKKQLV